jgi:predicted MPP superfamily phosphohydrolase
MPDRPATHLAGLVILFVLNRLAALALELEDAVAPVRHRIGAVTLAIGFSAAGGALGLAMSAVTWATVVRAGGLSAEASTFALVAHQWLGHEFQVVGWLGIVGGVGLVVDGYLRGHRRLVVTRLQVLLPHLPRALDGFRLVQVSDLHVGPLAHRDALRDAFDRVAAEDPDLVVVTGDIVDSPKANLGLWIPELPALRARRGVLAILGNHDRETGFDRVTQALRDTTDWVVLRDDVHPVTTPDGTLHVVGLHLRDTAHAGDAVAALAASLPADAPVVLLTHNPDAFPAAVEAGLPLTLAGHTHGGQVSVPGAPRWNPARLLMTRYDAGTFVERGCMLHVNRGLGVSGQRLRIGAPREITVVTLRSPAATD